VPYSQGLQGLHRAILTMRYSLSITVQYSLCKTHILTQYHCAILSVQYSHTHCAILSVQYSMCNTQCAILTVQYSHTLCNTLCNTHILSVQFSLCNTHCAILTVQYSHTLCNTLCAILSVQYSMCNNHCAILTYLFFLRYDQTEGCTARKVLSTLRVSLPR